MIRNLALPKQVAIAMRIIILGLGLFFIGGFILLGIAKMLGGTSGGTSEVIWTFIIMDIVLVAPAILGMLELFFHKNIKPQNL